MRFRTDLLKDYIFFLVLFIIISASNLLSIHIISGKVAIIVAVVWMIMTTVIYVLFVRKNKEKDKKKNVIILYAVLNAIIGGIAVSSYYSLKNVTPYNPLFIIGAFGLLLIINYCLVHIIRKKVLFSGANIILTILLFILALAYTLSQENLLSLRSSLVFMLAVYLCFSVSQFIVIKKNLDLHSIIPLSSLFMFGGLLIVAFILITDGDGLEIFEVFFAGDPTEQKNKAVIK